MSRMFPPVPVRMLAISLLVLGIPAVGDGADQPFVMEGYPDKIQARIETVERFFREHALAAPGDDHSFAAQYFLNTSRKWVPGQTLKVGFAGGTPALREKIEKAALQWSGYCNITLNFREGAAFREWSSSDTGYTADIRISFDQEGYWSMIGRDSITPSVASPNEASMNFGGFVSLLPSDYATTVEHEFGHALGFEHEHQHPLNGCDHDFRWENDPGYTATQDSYGQYIADASGKRPGIYTILGGPPNNWSKAKVDFNLKELPDSHAYAIGPFDGKSIMKYYFPDWMFVSGTTSHCYSAENLDISSGDRQGAALLYPKAPQEVQEAVEKQKAVLNTVLQLKGLQPVLQQRYRLQLNSLPQ
jgi:hypothetical protein